MLAGPTFETFLPWFEDEPDELAFGFLPKAQARPPDI